MIRFLVILSRGLNTIVPIPKVMKSNLKCSENYRPIAITSLLGKVFNKIIIPQEHDFLFSSSYQFGFKPHSSTVLCSTLLIETIEHYVHDARQPAYVLLFDASKALDRVCFNELFTMLIKRNVSPFVIRFLLCMYTRVQWKHCLSDNFSIGNGVRQGAVLSPLLFTLYIDMLFIRFQDLGLGCHIGLIFAGSFGYADDVALVAPTLYVMVKMIKVCEIFADKIGLLFNPLKSNLLCLMNYLQC